MKIHLLLLFLFISSCQMGRDLHIVLHNGERVTLEYEETLSTVISSEPPKIDWLTSSDTDSSWIEENIMQGLVRFDLTKPGLKVVPALATQWKSLENGKVWEFELRKNVKWSDGVPFTSQHVIDGFQRILTPETAAIAVDNIFPVRNAKLFNQQKIKDFKKVGVKALGLYKVRFELEYPMAFFPLLLTHHTTFPIRLDVIEKHKELWTEPENIVTLGPYKLIYWHHDSRMFLQRNEPHWGDRPKIKNLVFYMIGKPATALRMFERGKIDLIRDLPSSEIERLSQKPEFHSLPGLRLYYFGFKVKKEPFDDPRVRRAFAMAIDRKEITTILGGGQLPLKSWVPQGMFGHDENVGLDFNPQKALELLKEAGYEGGQGLPVVTLGFNTEEKHNRVAENVQNQLKRNLGVKVELKNEEWKTFLNGLRSDSAYSMFRFGWVADYADPHNFLANMTSFSENNRTGWGNTEYDKLVLKGLQEQDPEKRLEIYHQAQKILVEQELPAIPLLTDVNQLLVSKRVSNYHDNVLDIYQFYTMGLQP